MTKRERYQKAIEGLSQTIFHLTWLGEFWGIGGAILLDEVRSWYTVHLCSGCLSDTLGSRSSTYYAASENAKKRADKAFFLKPWWLAIATVCFLRGFLLSIRAKKLLGIKGMSSDLLDILSHYYRRLGWHREALECVEEGLSRPYVAENTRVLLLMGKAESIAKLGNRAAAEIAYSKALGLKDEVPASTQVRLLRSFAEHRRAIGAESEADRLSREARIIAAENSLDDQFEKIARRSGL